MKDGQDEELFADIIFALSKAFQAKIEAETIDIYFRFLKDLPLPLIAKAVQKTIQTGKAFPTIREIREIALFCEDDKIEAAALKAWSDANEKASEFILDMKTPPADLDEAIRLAFGSWEAFGKLDERNEPYDRPHFLRCYRSLAKRKQTQQLLGPGIDIKKLKAKFS
jgi:hypothetical protein